MSNFITIKLRTGEDIVGIVEQEFSDHIVVNNPIEMVMDPVNGFYAKSWLLLAETNTITIFKNDMLFCGNANDKAIHYYEEFSSKISSQLLKDTNQDDDYTAELEELFTSLLESKSSIKH